MKRRLSHRFLSFFLLFVFICFRTVLFLPRTMFYENEPVASENLFQIVVSFLVVGLFSALVALLLCKRALFLGEKAVIAFSAILLADSMFFRSLTDIRSYLIVAIAVILLFLRNHFVLSLLLSTGFAFVVPILNPGSVFSVLPILLCIYYLDRKKERSSSISLLQLILPVVSGVCGYILKESIRERLEPLFYEQIFHPDSSIEDINRRAHFWLLIAVIPTILIAAVFLFNILKQKRSGKTNEDFRYYNKVIVCMILLVVFHIVGVILYPTSQILCVNLALPLILLTTNEKEENYRLINGMDKFRTKTPVLSFVLCFAWIGFNAFVSIRYLRYINQLETLLSMLNTRL